MLALPLPILTFVLSAVACVLMWRFDLGNRLARGLFTAVFALIATGTLLVGLRFGYGIDRFIVIQRVIPLFVGPMIYLGFIALTTAPSAVKTRALSHLGLASVAALIPQLFPMLRAGFDFAIGASYLFYTIALLMLWRQGPDRLTYAPLSMIGTVHKWMLSAAGMLSVMLVFDSIIALSFAMERSEDAVWLISMGSLVSMISLIGAIVIFSRGARTPHAPNPVSTPLNDQALALEQTARTLLTKTELYLETDLTLERLAKRLHVPSRALSSAINSTQDMNVSQYVNGFRLAHAASLLEDSNMSVVRVMERSGFLTRSNFYREFERVYAVSPSEFRKRASQRPS